MATRKSTKTALLAEQVPTIVMPASFDAALLTVLETAVAEGRASGATLDAIRVALDFSKDEKHIALVRDEFYVGRLMAKCNLEESAARVQLGKKPFNFLPAFAGKMTDENRTENAQRALNAARVRIAEILNELGIETARTGVGGAPRAPRPEGNAATATPLASGSSVAGPAKTSLVSGAISVPKAANAADVVATAVRFGTLMSEFLNNSSEALKGDVGSIIRNALTTCKAEITRAAKLAADPKAARRAELVAELAAMDAAA